MNGDSRAAAPAPAPRSPSDAEAVSRVLAGDSDAFRWIVERYQARVFTHIFRIVRQAEDAEDLAQETFLRAYRALERYDPAYSFSSWLFTIATRLALNAVRDRKPRALSLEAPFAAGKDGDEIALENIIESPGESPAEQLAAGELRERLEAASDRLPAAMRAVFNLRYQQDLPLQEIGQITGMSLSAVKVSLHRARGFLKEWMGL